jgi:hypothetical protein
VKASRALIPRRSKRSRRSRPGLGTGRHSAGRWQLGLDAVNEMLASSPCRSSLSPRTPERLLTGERPEPAFLITKPFQPETVKAVISQALVLRAPGGALGRRTPPGPAPFGTGGASRRFALVSREPDMAGWVPHFAIAGTAAAGSALRDPRPRRRAGADRVFPLPYRDDGFSRARGGPATRLPPGRGLAPPAGWCGRGSGLSSLAPQPRRRVGPEGRLPAAPGRSDRSGGRIRTSKVWAAVADSGGGPA